jgi:hypothetical protein
MNEKFQINVLEEIKISVAKYIFSEIFTVYETITKKHRRAKQTICDRK